MPERDPVHPQPPAAHRGHLLHTMGEVVLVWLLLPLAFLPLGSPYALVTLPLLAQRFLSSRTHLWTTQFHYNAPIFLILLFAAVDTIGRLPNAARDWAHRRDGDGDDGRRPRHRPRVADDQHAPHPAVLVGLAHQARSWDQQAMVALVPAGTCVGVDDRLAPHLTRSNRVTLPTLTRRMSDFIVLDLSQKQVGYPLPSPQQIQADALARGYTQVASSGPLDHAATP